MFGEKRIAFPELKSFDDLFEKNFSFDKETGPSPYKWQLTSDTNSFATVQRSNDIGPYCAVDSPRGHDALYVQAKDFVIEYITKEMLFLDYDSLYYQIVFRRHADGSDANEALVCVKHNNIIGDRWLALIDPKTVPFEDPEEAAGIEAIVALQRIAGIKEPVHKARAGWRNMDEAQRLITMAAYEVLTKEPG